MLYMIEDTKPDGTVVRRTYCEAEDASQARTKAGAMPTLTRTTVPMTKMPDGRLVPMHSLV